MKKLLVGAAAVAVLAAGPASAQQKSVKIGFISTFSGPTHVIGNDIFISGREFSKQQLALDFRQLPAGVPGAFRLFANLLALADRTPPR